MTTEKMTTNEKMTTKFKLAISRKCEYLSTKRHTS
jgi:hypothetical protein